MKISATILAAGGSKRMGELNKLLLLIDNEPIIKIVCESVLKAKLDQVILVTGYQSSEVIKVVPNEINEIVNNKDWEKGMMSSIYVGMSRINEDIDGNIIILGDMPLISSKTIKSIIKEFNKYNGRNIVYPIYNDRQANPVIFPRKYFSEILFSDGDRGCKKVLKKYPQDSIGIKIKSDEVILDCDTRDDYLLVEKRKLNNVQT